MLFKNETKNLETAGLKNLEHFLNRYFEISG